LFPKAQLATPGKLELGRSFAKALESGGGTEMASAIELALSNQILDTSSGLRQVIFVTDGAVGNEEALFDLIKRQLGSSRLFTVGIGSAPNSYFMRKSAAFGRGTFTYIGDAREVAEKMRALFDVLATPTLRDIQLDWPVASESFPNLVPDLYAGEPLVVTAKLAEIKGKLALSARTADRDWLRNIQLNKSQQSKGVSTLWARDKIDWWEDQIILNGESDKSRVGILNLALEYQLMSRYTSFLAVEKTPSRPTGDEPKTKSILNARPAGQQAQSFAYPQTALGGPPSMLFGLAAFFGWLYAKYLWRRTNASTS
ncbi:MAG: marine proteobacterial sortase target protein, partial [Gammaproteobacteria bacterium]|nr:marine proteobacterial sortase target protein [Gammaproteobacteria bacterium]